MNERLNTILKRLLDTRAAGVYILVFAIASGVATFVENDFGTATAQKLIFKSLWFELLLLLFSMSLVYNVIRFRMIQNRRWALMLFHMSMIIIFIGAGITRYFGYEGMMHIREGDASNTFLSAEKYIRLDIEKDGQTFSFEDEVLFGSLGSNSWKNEFFVGNDLLEVELKNYIPNPVQQIDESESGEAILKVVFGGANGREEYYIKNGRTENFRNVIFNFGNDPIPGAINIEYVDNELTIQSDKVLMQTVMATQQRDTLRPKEGKHTLRLRSLYTDGINSFVFGDFNSSGNVSLVSESLKIKSESLEALAFDVSVNGVRKEAVVIGQKGVAGRPVVRNFGNMNLALSYGAKTRTVPFRIQLYDFIMERYPGTNSAASYASEVQLIDDRNNVKKDYRIFMNNILNYKGYRFFQSSFDRDEKGTYLSVNHDFWGTWVSYLGYFLLTLGMILSFFSKKSRFYQVVQKLSKRPGIAIWIGVIVFMTLGSELSAQTELEQNIKAVSAHHAELFSKVIVQDQKGRMKPMHTLNREILRKLSKKESYKGLNADQVILSMYADRQSWLSIPLIKSSKSEKVQELLGTDNEYLAYKDFFALDGKYKLRDELGAAYAMQSRDRGTYEKDLLKIDERLNIMSMVFSNRLFKIVPVPGHPNNAWVSSHLDELGDESIDQPVATRFFDAYQISLADAMVTGNYELADLVIEELRNYQHTHGAEIIPSQTQLDLEILLNKMKVFSRLSMFYLTLGLVFLVFLFLNVFRPEMKMDKLFMFFFTLVVFGFLMHTVGLGIRWYVSERAPWSNGYESMIYIAWTSCLAGLIFTRRSLGGLAATMVLAGTILLVAQLSYLDPEITPLVPVLRSYWLTIHVSLIAGSYGFLMLGALIGLINLSLFMFLKESNKARVISKAREMSYISEITLIGGLVMLSIGTYLGGVWANESWGRYWGWDAKETWALVTILVYAFILHMRLIPGLQSLYAYNVAKLFGWASVIMTYFGVNYYLSGLHSYAAGDPIPIPNWVYYSVVTVTIISIIAYIRYRKFSK